REAAGNPLALVELPRSSHSEDDREAAWLPLTERLERTFSSRLSDLPEVLRKLIELDATEARFRHPLARSAIHQAADLAIRQKVHAALAGVIEDQDRKLWHRAAAAMGPD